MSDDGNEFVKIMKVTDFEAGRKPIDITAHVTGVLPAAIPRILSRFERSDSSWSNPDPSFYSIARTCTHQRCNVLVGGNWGTVEKPITYSTIDLSGDARPIIECPCHGSRFDLRSGKKVRDPETGTATDLATFETKVEEIEGDQYVFVAIEPQE